jgi:hypothetical protein
MQHPLSSTCHLGPGVIYSSVGSSYKLIIEPNLIISQGMEKAERDSILSNKYDCVNIMNGNYNEFMGRYDWTHPFTDPTCSRDPGIFSKKSKNMNISC